MKAFVVAFAALALLAAPALAQSHGASGHAKLPEKPKPDEKAYKAALEKIPDSKQKYDPWGGVAPAAPAPATTQTAKKK